MEAVRIHFACHHSAYGRFAHIRHLDAEEHDAASVPASWMIVRPSSVCEADSSAVEEVSWTRSSSGIGRVEGQRRRCWRRRHPVGNSTSFQIHRDGGHRIGLADSLPFYLPTLIKGQILFALSAGCWPLLGGSGRTPTPRREGESLFDLRCQDQNGPFI